MVPVTPDRVYLYEPDHVLPPGATLEEILQLRRMTQADLARRTGLSTKHVNQMIKGTASISPEIALRLARATGVPARIWNGLEAAYQEQRSKRQEATALEADTSWLKDLPIRELVKRGWIRSRPDAVDQLREILAFFGVANREAFDTLWSNVNFRKAQVFQSDPGAVAAWLRIGELTALKIACEPFDRARFVAALHAARQLTLERDPAIWVPELQSQCAAAGVAVVIVQEIPKSRVHGAIQWLAPDFALVQLSFRYRVNDIFWFTFFHEGRHVLQQSKKQVFLENTSTADDELERDANDFARSLLIPPQYESALRRIESFEDVEHLAADLSIAPGIIVGRLQHEGLKPWSWGAKLKWRYEFAEHDQ